MRVIVRAENVAFQSDPVTCNMELLLRYRVSSSDPDGTWLDTGALVRALHNTVRGAFCAALPPGTVTVFVPDGAAGAFLDEQTEGA